MRDYEIVGSCPKCGAPVYAKDEWEHADTPPQSVTTCECALADGGSMIHGGSGLVARWDNSSAAPPVVNIVNKVRDEIEEAVPVPSASARIHLALLLNVLDEHANGIVVDGERIGDRTRISPLLAWREKMAEARLVAPPPKLP